MASGQARVAPMGEKFIGVAMGAAIGGGDAVVGEAEGSELQMHGAPKIDMGAVGASGTEGGIGTKVVGEGAGDLGTDLKSVDSDAGTDGGQESVGCDVGVVDQGLECLGDGVGDHAAPPGVDGGDPPSIGGGQEDRNTVGGADGEEACGVIAEQGVGLDTGYQRLVASNQDRAVPVHLVDR